MERKTYYTILGVSSTESETGIRAAYRDLAKRLHPDVAGPQATRSFQELSEAYSVLSDPLRRRDYNDMLDRARDAKIAVRRSPPEPLVREPAATRGYRQRIRRSFEPMYDRFLRNFAGISGPKAEHLERLDVEVLLTAEEASHGCVVPVVVPVFTCCPQCGGSGQDGAFACAYCHRQGMIENESRFQIQIPPMARSGSMYEVPLQGLGVHDFYLRLHVLVAAHRV
jgi:DnaJ-class molecular chaperone